MIFLDYVATCFQLDCFSKTMDLKIAFYNFTKIFLTLDCKPLGPKKKKFCQKECGSTLHTFLSLREMPETSVVTTISLCQGDQLWEWQQELLLLAGKREVSTVVSGWRGPLCG